MMTDTGRLYKVTLAAQATGRATLTAAPTLFDDRLDVMLWTAKVLTFCTVLLRAVAALLDLLGR